MDKLRAFLKSPYNRLSRLDMVLFCRYGSRRNHAMARLDISPDSRRNRPKVYASRILLQLFLAQTRTKGRIHVYMKNRPVPFFRLF